MWADDEIDLLKPHILFLTNKGYEVTSVNNGNDAFDMIKSESFDLVFLDENMPGKSGLETLSSIKTYNPNIPVVMITKNEEEHIMEEAIGSKIADYLIKPLNPNQILLSLKRVLDHDRIITEKTNLNYQQEFTNLSSILSEDLDHEGWAELYRKLIFWELQIDSTEEKSMSEILLMQKNDANRKFAQYVEDNYRNWIAENASAPLMSHDILKKRVFPMMNDNQVNLIVIDNLRFDQWEIIEQEIAKIFDLDSKEHYYSILPTTTAYARNSLFGGMLPLEIAENFPQFWVGEDESKPKNNFEKELLDANLRRNNIDKKFSYNKIIQAKDGRSLSENTDQILNCELNAVVYNFVDMLSHARTDMQMIRELAPDESAYRALTRTWFSHSHLLETLKRLADRKAKVVITTDHGTIRVKRPEKIVGDRNTNTNLRFKTGKNLNFDEKNVFSTRSPKHLQLPQSHVSSSFAFAVEDKFFAYPNNYNHYVNFYKDTFQHGGISMEEMIIPFIVLNPK